MKVYFHLRFVFENVFDTANFTMNLNTATFEELLSLAGLGHGRAQAIFDGRAKWEFQPMWGKPWLTLLKSRPYLVTK